MWINGEQMRDNSRLWIAFVCVAGLVGLVSCALDPDAAAWRDAGVPEWLPPYPQTEPVLLSESESGADLAGMISFVVAAEPEASGEIYKSLLEAAGFAVRFFPFDTPGGRTWRLEGDDETGTLGVYLTISPTAGSESSAQFVLNYSKAL